MDFRVAGERLKDCPSDREIASECGVSVQLIRQARLGEINPSSREPPKGWAGAVARLARRRAAELLELAAELERAGK